MMELKETFTSTGNKLLFHREAMEGLRAGKPRVISTHIMPTDRCQDRCSFCSVATRDGDSLPLADMLSYVDTLRQYGLRAVIVSGGGNPILYRCPKEGYNFNHLIEEVHRRGLKIGLITNGAPLVSYGDRCSWKMVRPETLDMLEWVRISFSGLDHDRDCVEVPSVDPAKTTLGGSWVLHDSYDEPKHEQHGQVSTPADLITLGVERLNDSRIQEPRYGKDRVPKVTEQIIELVKTHPFKYVRLLPNCLETGSLMAERWAVLDGMAESINEAAGRAVAFTQRKPPQPPKHCYNGYVRPCLAPSGMVFPCDSVTLSAAELGYKTGQPTHKFNDPWAICHWSEIGKLFEQPVRSLVDSQKLCEGCVFWQQQAILESVVDGSADLTPVGDVPDHVDFI